MNYCGAFTLSTFNRPSYRHGNLKTALLDAADALLDEGGAGAVSLREAARRTGVSANATYRHFADKEALLAALATRGFVELAETLVEAAAQASDPMAAMGQAYVRFALARPGRFRLMFGPTIADRELYPELKDVVAQIRQMLLGAVQSRAAPGDDARARTLRAWSMVHGIAQLLLDGMLPGANPEEIIRQIITTRACDL